MNVISQPDNLPLSYSHKHSFCFNISSLFSPAVRTIRYYRSIGFHPYQRKKSGTCGLLRGEALLWLGDDLRDGGSITKSRRTSSCFCLYWVMTFWRATPGGNKQECVANSFIKCGLPLWTWAHMCVSVFLRPSGTPNYLMPPREFDAKMCAVKWDSAGECVLYFTWFSSERAAPDDKAKTTSLSLVRVRWKVCHTSSMVSDIRKCLLTVGALSSSHSTSVCWHKQQRKSRVTLDHIITQKLFFSIVRNLKMVSQMHLNHLAVLWPSKSSISQAVRNRFSQITLLLY